MPSAAKKLSENPLEVYSLRKLTTVEEALVYLGNWLKDQNYFFTTITPKSHQILNHKPENFQARQLRDIFGWSRPFKKELLPLEIFKLLEQNNLLKIHSPHLFLSKIRYSRLEDLLICHSSFPTQEADSVFFGPDTYRFANAIKNLFRSCPYFSPNHILELACGSGAPGLISKKIFEKSKILTLSDINDEALSFSHVNATLAGEEEVQIVESNLFENLPNSFDLILANPPYLLDPQLRSYRHGGGNFGTELSFNILKQSIEHLNAQGQLLLYTGCPIIEGKDIFYEEASSFLNQRKINFSYEEIDPDVFGEELEQEHMRNVERIAVVVLRVFI